MSNGKGITCSLAVERMLEKACDENSNLMERITNWSKPWYPDHVNHEEVGIGKYQSIEGKILLPAGHGTDNGITGELHHQLRVSFVEVVPDQRENYLQCLEHVQQQGHNPGLLGAQLSDLSVGNQKKFLSRQQQSALLQQVDVIVLFGKKACGVGRLTSWIVCGL
ncbi:hypothetical protein SUGI_0367420 [Cryptomeria japonica]|nr:hypothetical protein SUGI_0367420 [Cryptomeria japonica]